MSTAFDYDWFSGNIPWFEKYLSPLRGRPCRALEIGCHEGRASTWLLQNILTHPEARLTAIDIYLQPNYWANIDAVHGRAKTELLLKNSRVALRELPFNTFDFVYIDGNHWTVDVLEDAVLSFRLAKTGAVIAFDDYLWDVEGFNQEGSPKPAIDAFLNLYKPKIEVLFQGYQVWLKKLSE